jgi:hypothetical protein
LEIKSIEGPKLHFKKTGTFHSVLNNGCKSRKLNEL